jgi:hypothetical protein
MRSALTHGILHIRSVLTPLYPSLPPFLYIATQVGNFLRVQELLGSSDGSDFDEQESLTLRNPLHFAVSKNKVRKEISLTSLPKIDSLRSEDRIIINKFYELYSPRLSYQAHG